MMDISLAPDLPQLLLGNPCGQTSCIGDTGAWWSQVAAQCASSGLAVVYFEPADPCPKGSRAAKFSCCPPGPLLVQLLQPSSAGCPVTFDAWALGTPCANLYCNYPTWCGAITSWHCKNGWSNNASCYCGK